MTTALAPRTCADTNAGLRTVDDVRLANRHLRRARRRPPSDAVADRSDAPAFPRPRVRATGPRGSDPRPRFDAAKSVLAANASALLVAECTSLDPVRKRLGLRAGCAERRAVVRPSFHRILFLPRASTTTMRNTRPDQRQYGARIQETRHQFHEDLAELERQTLGGLELVIGALDRAVESVIYQDVELAVMAIADGGTDRPALAGDPTRRPDDARTPGAGRGRSADRGCAVAHHPLHRADEQPVRDHRQARATIGPRIAQGQGHRRRDPAHG